ncbi:hypothetical protein MIZ01_0396 [Sideroxyarcus emersonii]|uniref:Uncharacterized protein n=1 Tax=Sideroxyarcus emersonii TaxID=2764705 RepID=A0AAN2BYD6_9PROT|nr:hypothetical protein MIZ01_0396 [Sideroxyarcus emersonii]
MLKKFRRIITRQSGSKVPSCASVWRGAAGVPGFGLCGAKC